MKPNVRKLLLLLLALTLVLALSACNFFGGEGEQDEEDETAKKAKPPVEIESAEFLEQMFSAIGGIGRTAVDATRDLEIKLGGALQLTFGENVSDTVFSLSLILDRTSTGAESGDHTSLKLSLTSGGEEISIAYFLADPYKIYIDFPNDKQYLGFDIGINDTFANAVDGVLNNYDLGLGFSAMELLNTATATFGEEFTVDQLLSAVLELIDLSSLLEDLPVDESMLGGSLDGALTNIGSGNVSTALTDMAGLLFDENAISKSADGLVYRAELSTLAVTAVSVLVPAPAIFNIRNTFAIGFEKKTSEINSPVKNLFLEAILTGYGEEKDQNIGFKLVLDSPIFANVDGDKAKEHYGITGEYSSLAFGAEIELDIPEDMLVCNLSDSEIPQPTDIGGTYVVKLDGALNLDDLSKTALDFSVKKNDDTVAAVTYAHVSDSGVLTAKFDKTAPLGIMLAETFGSLIFDEEDEAATIAAFEASGELKITGINLKSAIPVWTGDSAQAIGYSEDEEKSELELAMEALSICEPDILSGKGFFNYLLKNYSSTEEKTVLSFDTLGDAFLEMFTGEYETIEEFVQQLYAIRFTLDGEEFLMSDKIDKILADFEGSAFVGDNSIETLINLFSSKVTLTAYATDDLANEELALTYGNKTATLTVRAYMLDGLTTSPLTLSENAAEIVAPMPLIEWGGIFDDLA